MTTCTAVYTALAPVNRLNLGAAGRLELGELAIEALFPGATRAAALTHSAACKALHMGVIESRLPESACLPIRRHHMTRLSLFIFLGAAAAPSVHAGDTKDARRDVFDVCNQFVINEPDQPISFGFTRDCILYDPDMRAPEWRAW